MMKNKGKNKKSMPSYDNGGDILKYGSQLAPLLNLIAPGLGTGVGAAMGMGSQFIDAQEMKKRQAVAANSNPTNYQNTNAFGYDEGGWITEPLLPSNPALFGDSNTSFANEENIEKMKQELMRQLANNWNQKKASGKQSQRQSPKQTGNSKNSFDSETARKQRILVDAGYDIGAYGKNKDGIDGILGAKTKAAWNKYLSDKKNDILDENGMPVVLEQSKNKTYNNALSPYQLKLLKEFDRSQKEYAFNADNMSYLVNAMGDYLFKENNEKKQEFEERLNNEKRQKLLNQKQRIQDKYGKEKVQFVGYDNGGDLSKLNQMSYDVNANPNEVDPMLLNYKGQDIRVGDNEIIDAQKDRVISENFYNPVTGKKIVDEYRKVERAIGKAEKQGNDLASNNSVKFLNLIKDNLFNMQESVKSALTSQNQNNEQGFRYGGPIDPPDKKKENEIPSFADDALFYMGKLKQSQSLSNGNILMTAGKLLKPIGTLNYLNEGNYLKAAFNNAPFANEALDFAIPGWDSKEANNGIKNSFLSIPKATNVFKDKVKSTFGFDNGGLLNIASKSKDSMFKMQEAIKQALMPKSENNQQYDNGGWIHPLMNNPLFKTYTPQGQAYLTGNDILLEPLKSKIDLSGAAAIAGIPQSNIDNYNKYSLLRNTYDKMTPAERMAADAQLAQQYQLDKDAGIANMKKNNALNTNSTVTSKPNFFSDWTTGDKAMVGSTALALLAQGIEATRPVQKEQYRYNSAPISRIQMNVNQPLQNNQAAYLAGLNSLGSATNSASRQAAMQALFANKLRADNDVMAQYGNQNAQLDSQYEERLSNRNQNNINMSMQVDDLNSRNRAAAEKMRQNLYSSVANFGQSFGNMQNSRLTNKMALEQFRLLAPDVYANWMKNQEQLKKITGQ